MKLKRILVGITAASLFYALFALTVVPASAVGKASPKTTGGIGYSAYGLQRYAEFNAIETSTECTSSWNLSGSYVFTLNLGATYSHDINLTQIGPTLTGAGGYPAGGPYSVTEAISGTASGSSFIFTSTYTPGPYSYTVSGTVNANGTLSVTSWSSSLGQAGGSWTVTGTATKNVSGCTGKGIFNYSDVNGNFYTVDVQYVDVVGYKSWFAGPVISGNVGAGAWLFAKTVDMGEPGIGSDTISGSFTSPALAKVGVGLNADPSDGPFTVTSGNLQVH